MSSTYKFKAETHKVLNILTHSLYTNREIFLRELLSNASDALDKLRFKQNKGESVIAPELPLEIKISTDKDGHILTVQDSGIGMTKQEMQDNLGIIAKSGSEKFLKDIGDTSCDSSKVKIDPYAEEEIVEKDGANTATLLKLSVVLGLVFIQYSWLLIKWKSILFLLLKAKRMKTAQKPMFGLPQVQTALLLALLKKLQAFPAAP